MTDGPAVQTFGSVDIPDAAFDGPAETVEAPEAAEAMTSGDLALDHPETPEVEAPEAPAEPTVFDEKYVKELRSESANYRTKAKPYVEAFDGIEEADRDVFLGLANLYKTDPIAAGREMARLAQGLTEGAPNEDVAPAAKPLTEGYMTEARYNEIKRNEGMAAAQQQIESEALSLGYPKETPEYNYLVAVARTKGGDLNAAHAYIEGRQQDAVSKYVASKTAEAEGSPTVSSNTGAPASSERSLKTWREVEAAIDEMF